MKVIVLRRNSLTFCLSAVILGVMLWLVNNPQAVLTTAVQRQLPIYCVQHDQPVAALTFDAAWGNEDTQQLIQIMDEYDISATFFVVGEWVDRYPESVKALADAGHSIQNHSDTHPYLTKCSPLEIRQELESCNEKIKAITGIAPDLIRCPYGDYNDQVVSTIRSMGMEPIQWDVDSLDWKDLSAEEITKRVIDQAGPGSIILFHNAALHTPEALPTIIEALRAEGYQFCTVSDLLIEGRYSIDHEGRQIRAE